ncbi:WbqC family protein [Rhodoferax aquaticus]|uniref:WbqC family protein n=1 Tax=Rhodoferax aquaticus TaxID=2527691 RepID=A0A515EP49_9BURK|nr:WbqC family protein [Rhodoferax aquaticus]QDL54438.1 hypothetical protein EXZ61_09840 [Rhodoferax aquaticus]
MKVAILQSNYIPWKGYFDLIASVDELIIYDDVQYTRRDWRNRNQIMTAQGVQWLSIPVQVKGRYEQKIKEVVVDGREWYKAHWKTILQNYKRAPFFEEIASWLEPVYSEGRFERLTDLNRHLIELICRQLAIKTRISNSCDYVLINGKTERLVDLCRQSGANEYISGPSAKSYIDKSLFEHYGIALKWFNYDGYPEYKQQFSGFSHHVSVIDLLFNTGPCASRFMKHHSKLCDT